MSVLNRAFSPCWLALCVAAVLLLWMLIVITTHVEESVLCTIGRKLNKEHVGTSWDHQFCPLVNIQKAQRCFLRLLVKVDIVGVGRLNPQGEVTRDRAQCSFMGGNEGG